MKAEKVLSEIVFTSREVPAHKFRIAEAKITERLDYPYHIECICYYEGVSNEPLSNGIYGILDMNVRVYLNDPSYTNMAEKQSVTKLFKGIVKEAVYLGDKELSSNFTKEHRYYYRMIISSQLMRLSYNKAYRIYNNKSVLDVLQIIYENAKGPVSIPFDFSRIQNSFKQEEYISQYNESDLEFLLRLCSNYGIYFVENEEGVYFYDSVQKADFDLKNNKLNMSEISKHVTYPYNPSSDNYLSSLCISHIESGMAMGSLWSIFSSSNAGMPHLDELSISQNYWSEREVDNRDKLTGYALHKDLSTASFSERAYRNGLQFQSTLNLLSRDVERTKIKAKSNILSLNVNDVLTVAGAEEENTYRITGIVHYYHDKSEQGGRLLEQEPSLYSMYSNELYLIPNTMPYTMKYIDKPHVFGVTLGVVIGKSEDIDSERNTIVIDEYGRVRVRLSSMAVQGMYDDSPVNNDKYTHSCYLRYASPAASNNSGFIAVPRVGDEVIISYIDGDINRPVITGSLYNMSSPSLIQSDILSSKHKTSLSSKTVGRGEQGRNELTMSNLPGSEQIYLKAEKDYEELVQNNYDQTILNNKTSKVTGTHTENILQAHIQNIAGVKDVNVGGEYLTVVALSKDTAVGLSNTLNVGASNKVNVAIDSSENVGKNKEVIIGGNLEESITLDKTVNIDGESKTVIKGSLVEQVNKDTTLTTEGEYSLTVNKSITSTAKESINLSCEKEMIVENDSLSMTTKSDISLTADNSTLITVGDAEVSIKSDKVIIKVGSVEMTLSSSGVEVTGGKIKAK
ncbi:MAG: type VI secretion system tip protein TssI/VgrG [Mucispirillum sp.]|nr:type VI secretion system tip protein TssI/VgrG [Mucispirillum sp.]